MDIVYMPFEKIFSDVLNTNGTLYDIAAFIPIINNIWNVSYVSC